MFLLTKWKLNCKNEYELQQIVNQENDDILTINDLLFADNKYYLDNLDRFSIYLLNFLLCKGFKNVSDLDDLKENTFFTILHNGECNAFYIQTTHKITFYNFKKKFGINFKDYKTNKLLLDYAEENHRNFASLGADAYNEFIHTLFRPKKDPNANKKLMRDDFPILKDKMLEKAKKFCAGYQFYKKGDYNNVYNYDQASAFPSQLLNRTPTGSPKKDIKSLEQIPTNYWYCVDIIYFNLKLKFGHDWLKIDGLPSHGHLYLTKELHELFLETYTADYKIVDILAFKTVRNRFNKFVEKNVIKGKLNCKNPNIAKYNKYIANSLIGYCGRNLSVKINQFKLKNKKCIVKSKTKQIDPLYLPLYLYVNGKQKAEFIKTLNRIDGIIYANTDGFIVTQPQNLNKLNSRITGELGAFKYKCEYEILHIETINGYAGITTFGEVDNTIAGMRLEHIISPEQYAQQDFTYYIEYTTPELKVKRVDIKTKGQA